MNIAKAILEEALDRQQQVADDDEDMMPLEMIIDYSFDGLRDEVDYLVGNMKMSLKASLATAYLKLAEARENVEELKMRLGEF